MKCLSMINLLCEWYDRLDINIIFDMCCNVHIPYMSVYIYMYVFKVTIYFMAIKLLFLENSN